jgi:hypothetical protein
MRATWIATFLALTASSAVAASTAAASQDSSATTPLVPPVQAVRLTSPVTMDGVLSDAVWQGAPAVTRLTQSDPDEGAAPRESTWVWVAYDEQALYVAARCWDSRPDSVLANLSRRDLVLPGDRFMLYLDPFHDHRGGFYYGVGAAGVRLDGTLFNDGWDDDSWDGVWDGRAKRDDKGWTVEMRVPFSQMRYRRGAEQVWGVSFRRRIERYNEDDRLTYTPRKESGFVSRFAHLVGLENGHSSRSIEVLPYVTTKSEFLAHAPGDPFHDGSRHTPGLGGDLRAGVGNNLTLNATVNPDFGQVEVDPAVVNLSDVETYFQEKRPFFTENARIFSFGNEGASDYWGFNWPEPSFFYTRRVGRAPQGGLPGDTRYRDVPMATHILGAAKLTGKLAPGLNFGTMHALTSKEIAQYEAGGLRSEMAVEPLTYYGVARGQKEFKQGYNGLGVMTTLVQRRFSHDELENQLNRQSLMTGLDGWHFLDAKKVWVLSGWAAMSRVAGTEARMTDLQQSSRHYFQRPDTRQLGVDADATSLTGYGARVWLNKQQGNFISNSAIGFMNPKFDIADMGFQSRADVINGHVGGGYRWTNPGRWRKYAHVIGSVFDTRDFEGNRLVTAVWAGTRWQFMNQWQLEMSADAAPQTMNNRRTRGGPVTLNRPMFEVNGWLGTDSKRALSYSLGCYGFRVPETRSFAFQLQPAVEWKPVSSFLMQVGPGIERYVEDAQYVTASQVPDPGNVPADFGGRHYVFARLDQTTVSANLRLNVSFTPDLSLQTFIQPLISAGHYTDFKELARSRSYDFLHHSTYDPATDMVDPDGPGPAPATPNDNWNFPQFNFKSLRGNAVLRWEYRPGSALFLVWTQERTDDQLFSGLEFRRSFDRLVTAQPSNIFLVKVSYYLGR